MGCLYEGKPDFGNDNETKTKTEAEPQLDELKLTDDIELSPRKGKKQRKHQRNKVRRVLSEAEERDLKDIYKCLRYDLSDLKKEYLQKKQAIIDEYEDKKFQNRMEHSRRKVSNEPIHIPWYKKIEPQPDRYSNYNTKLPTINDA
jgi:hypothetical protein